MPVTADQFRAAMRHWASGVSIVTTRRRDGVLGITVSSFCSLSLDPPLVLVCIDHHARSHEAIAREKAFAINFLGEDHAALSDLAAGRLGERGAWLENVPATTAATGAPILEPSIAWLDCSLAGRHEGGDHTIFIGRVEAAGGRGGRPLVYVHSDYGRLAPAASGARPRSGTAAAAPRRIARAAVKPRRRAEAAAGRRRPRRRG